ncbi:MAG: hypothetical protein ACYSW2_03095 [Planctomycetota bacterium]|jgi:hypothetical protein
MLRRIVPNRKSLRAFAVAGAWFFIVVSLGHLVWAVGQKWSDPAGTFKLYHAVVDGHSYDGWGLTYSGTLGLLTAMGQALLVAAAAAASVLPWPRTMKLRRIGHGVLCGWAALWALNFVWLASLDHHLVPTAQATLLCLLLGCTGYRATMGRPPGRSTSLPPDAPTGGMHSEDAGGTHSEIGAADRVVRGICTRLKPLVAASRHKTAAGLDRVGDFAHKQAQRIAIR